uniref:organic cation/carnitine transporter 7-like n=1 Tax=Erigeron canadensis TaxID=72917 RepID=UPI001CB9AF1F|nr:organic cation/carnitine transporter 7-like [Erigeron canadensis]
MADETSTYTLDEALEAIGFGKFQGWIFAYAGLGSIAEAMEVMILSFIGSSVRSEWNLSSTQESLITTVVFAGMLVGAYSWGVVSDNFGRRKGLLSIALVTSGASVLSAFSPNYISLVILRCIAGIGLGGGPTYNSWFLEFIPVPNRGIWMVVFATFWTIGTIVEAFLAWIVIPRYGWRWSLAVSSVPALAALIFYRLVPESPRYLCMKGQTTEAHNILKRAAAVNQRQLPSGILLSDQIKFSDDYLDTQEDYHLLSQKGNKKIASKRGFSTPRMLFSPNLIKTTFLLWILFFGNAFAYYGIILLTSVLSSGQSRCTPLTSFSVNNTEDSTYRDVFITSLAEVPGLIVSAFIVDRIGRKHSMALMFFIGFIFLLPLLSHQSEMFTTVSLFGSRMFLIGTFTVANIYAPEIYPTSVRTTGIGVASSVGRVGGMICPLVAVYLVNDCHQTTAIIVFEVVIILSGLCVMFFPQETMSRELADNISLPSMTEEYNGV